MIEEPLQLPCGIIVKNRIVKSAMSEALGEEYNNPTDGQIKLFVRRSQRGTTLLIAGNTPMDRWYMEHPANRIAKRGWQ